MDKVIGRDVICVEIVTHYDSFGENTYWTYNPSPVGYRLDTETLFEEEGIHIHIGYFKIIPPPLPTIEEAGIALVENWNPNIIQTDKGKALYDAVQRKLNADG